MLPWEGVREGFSKRGIKRAGTCDTNLQGQQVGAGISGRHYDDGRSL